MYWLRLEALRPLLDAHLEEWEFEVEAGQVDGTLAHAIERIVLKSIHATGYSHRAWSEDSQHNTPPTSTPGVIEPLPMQRKIQCAQR